MSISFPKPRSLAAVIAISLVAGGLSLAPATAAVAATTAQNQAKVLSTINTLRANTISEDPIGALASSAALTKIAQNYATASAKKGSAATEPASITVDANSDVAPTFDIVIKKVSSSTKAADAAATLTPSIVTDARYDFAGIGWVTKGSKTYVVALVADYATAPLETQSGSKPVILGGSSVGSFLSARVKFSTPAPDSITYEWFADSEPLTMFGNSPFIVLTGNTKGKSVTVKVTAQKANYETLVLTSAKTAKITAGDVTLGLDVEGDRNVGQTLYAETSGNIFIPLENVVVSYQWYRGSTKLTDETDEFYVQTAADKGKKVWVRFTFKATGFNKFTKDSNKSVVTTGKPIEYATNPTVVLPEGVSQIEAGTVVTVNKGDWSNVAPAAVGAGISLKVQWLLDGKVISGATKSSYTVPASAVGKSLSVRVTGTQSGYGATVRTSDYRYVYGKSFASSPSLTIAGTFVKGKTLTSKIKNLPTGAKVSYKWYSLSSYYLGKSISSGKTLKLTKSIADSSVVILVVTISKSGYYPVTLQGLKAIDGLPIG